MGISSHTTSIHILDDDSLLNVFNFYRPFLLGEDEHDDARLTGGKARWVRGRWWYKLAHVCQRWRNVIFGSSSYLALSLVCTNGTPVADMLAHSPPLPLVIDYSDEYRDFTTEDEEGAILALKQRDRVRRVRLFVRTMSLRDLIVAIDEEYPILEYLIIGRQIGDRTILEFRKTLQAPHLRHLMLIDFTLPIDSRFLTSAVDLVTLYLYMVHSSTYFHPNTLLQWLSFMPRLETLTIAFFDAFAFPNTDIYRQLTHTPITTPVTLRNLHCFKFRGGSTYLEALVHQIATPRLEQLLIIFSNQLSFSVPNLARFINATESLRFDSAKFVFFDGRVDMKLYSCGEAETFALSVIVKCSSPTWQVSSMAQISNALSQVFSAVECLALEEVHTPSSEGHGDVNPTEWRRLLGSFSNVKALLIGERLVKQVSRCLQLDDGEVPLELLPDLQEIAYSGSVKTGNAFTSFIDARQNAGHPFTLIRH